jgi:DNA-binding NarL/FixJ family response regulator
VLWQGQERDPRYWYKRETLHGLMEPLIDAELAPKLRAIIPAEVRQERRQEREDARWGDRYTGQGVKASNEQKRATARILKAQGQSLRAIAADLGVSTETVRKWIS